MRSDWNFDTFRTNPSVMGTYRSMARDLSSGLQNHLEEDEYEDFPDDGMDRPRSIDTEGATQGSGSDPIRRSIGSNPDASHSTMIIRPLPTAEPDVASLLAAEESSTKAESPPAYSGSVRSSRRSSYASRTDVRGEGVTLSEADLGTGKDTIRPVKKVDTVGSLRLSNDFVGSARRLAESGPSPPVSPSKERALPKRASEIAKAGKSIVSEVVLPILQNVRICILIALNMFSLKIFRLHATIWTLVR